IGLLSIKNAQPPWFIRVFLLITHLKDGPYPQLSTGRGILKKHPATTERGGVFLRDECFLCYSTTGVSGGRTSSAGVSSADGAAVLFSVTSSCGERSTSSAIRFPHK